MGDRFDLSDVKFELSNWLLDNLGLDADRFTSQVEKAKDIIELSKIATIIFNEVSNDKHLAEYGKPFFSFWQQTKGNFEH